MPTILGEFFAVGIGAALGAWMRWGLTWWLNDRHPKFPMGTLASNLIGGLCVGFALAYFVAHNDLPPHYRLFVITGFLGGLTTFSTFSSEVSMLLLRGDYLTGLALASTHLFGSLVLTIIGFWAYRAIAS